MNQPRPNLAPTSPHARGDLPTSDLAPRPYPERGEVTLRPPTATSLNTPLTRPRGHVTWTPDHISTKDAWDAIVGNLTQRDWGSQRLMATLARNTGLTPKRAADLIRSAIKHGHLQARLHPTAGSPQVRLPLESQR